MDYPELSLKKIARGATAVSGLLDVYHFLYLMGRLDRFPAGAVGLRAKPLRKTVLKRQLPLLSPTVVNPGLMLCLNLVVHLEVTMLKSCSLGDLYCSCSWVSVYSARGLNAFT